MKVSEVIKVLGDMQQAYGDLKVIITVHSDELNIINSDKSTLLSTEKIFFGYDQYQDSEDEINIRSFPY